MVRSFWIGLVGAGLVAGCRGPHSPGAGPVPSPRAAAGPGTNTLIVTPSGSVRGKIVVVNASARYVILSYPLGHVPQLDRRLAVYRNGLKVAEIKVGPQRIDTNAVADIVTGDCQPGDEVRDD